MSIGEQIPHLEALVTADEEIRILAEQIAQEKDAIESIRAEVAQLAERLAEDRRSVGEMDKTRLDLVQEMRQIDKQLERSRERFQRARNEREVNAAERELDELRKIQRDRSEETKKLVNLTEQARGSIKENEQRVSELTARLDGSLEGATETIRRLEATLAEKQHARQSMGDKLPKRVYRRYEMLRSRGLQPVAKTHDGTCLGCHIALPPMMFHEMLSRTKFEECPHCHRIIYYQPKEAAEDGKASADSTS